VRLDHLLSKEHTPRCQANVLARMVVFTSGIVDGQLAGYSWPCVGGGWGQAHCWVLKDQPFVGWLFWSSLCSRSPVWVVEGVGGVVV
jgi:hypothetical protein